LAEERIDFRRHVEFVFSKIAGDISQDGINLAIMFDGGNIELSELRGLLVEESFREIIRNDISGVVFSSERAAANLRAGALGSASFRIDFFFGNISTLGDSTVERLGSEIDSGSVSSINIKFITKVKSVFRLGRVCETSVFFRASSAIGDLTDGTIGL